jgi:hypothetical protein
MTRRIGWRAFATVLVWLVVSLGALHRVAGASDAQRATSPQLIGVLVVAFSPESKEARAFREGLRTAKPAVAAPVHCGRWAPACGRRVRCLSVRP